MMRDALVAAAVGFVSGWAVCLLQAVVGNKTIPPYTPPSEVDEPFDVWLTDDDRTPVKAGPVFRVGPDGAEELQGEAAVLWKAAFDEWRRTGQPPLVLRGERRTYTLEDLRAGYDEVVE